MPRRGHVQNKQVSADSKYGSLAVSRLVNRVMKGGNKRTAENIVYSALDIVEAQTKVPAVDALDMAIKNATPLVQVRPRRIAGATYQVPTEVKGKRGGSLALRWLVRSARTRAGKSMAEKLATELMDASQGQGAAVKKREELHKMANANKAFVHFRW